MSGMKWFGSKSSVQAGANVFQILFGLRAKAESTPLHDESADGGDFGSDIRWTASLYRGPDLPPWRLSILMAAGGQSALRMAPMPTQSYLKTMD